MADQSNREEIVGRIKELSKQQDEAMKDSTFMGTSPQQYVACRERSERIASLRRQLSRV